MLRIEKSNHAARSAAQRVLALIALASLLATSCGSGGSAGAQSAASAPPPVPGNPQTCPHAPPVGVNETGRTETGISGIVAGGVRYNFRYEVVWFEDGGQDGLYFQLADGTATTPVMVPSSWDTKVGGGAWMLQVPSTHPAASAMGGTLPVVLGGFQFENVPQTGRDGAEVRVGMADCTAVISGQFDLPNWPDEAIYVGRSPVFECPAGTYVIESYDAGADIYRARDLTYDATTAQYTRGAAQTLTRHPDTDSPEC